jgi:hypothetical protein
MRVRSHPIIVQNDDISHTFIKGLVRIAPLMHRTLVKNTLYGYVGYIQISCKIYAT